MIASYVRLRRRHPRDVLHVDGGFQDLPNFRPLRERLSAIIGHGFQPPLP